MLVSLNADPDRDQPGFSDTIVDARAAAQMRQDYGLMVRQHDEREHHALNTPFEQKAYFDRVSGMAHVFMGQVQNQQARLLGEKTEKALSDTPARKPLEVIAVAYAIYSGKTFKLRPNDDVVVKLRTHVPDRSGAVSVDSPLGEASYEVESNSPERARFTYSRQFPVLDVSGGVSVGMTTHTVVASVSKPLSAHLEAIYESTLAYEDTVRLAYGITF
jgi:hypothetical protein